MTRHYLDILADVIRENWDKPALTDFATLDGRPGNSYTYGQMYEQILALCDRFRQLGLKQGDHIAICGENSANWVVAYLAIAAFHGVSVTIVPMRGDWEIVEQITVADVKLLILDKTIGSSVGISEERGNRPVIYLDSFGCEHHDIRFETISLINSTYQNEELAQICFSSGTTGQAKGVMLPYRAINNNTQNMIDGFPDSENANFVSMLPPSHMYGLMTEAIGQLTKGKHVYFLGGTISIPYVWDALNKMQPYAIATIPMIAENLYKMYKDAFIELLCGSCQQMYIGGAFFNQEIENALLERHAHISIGYGSTETAPLISNVHWYKYQPHSCGIIVSGMEASVSSQGEILVRGENVMLGYYKDPEATAAKIDKDGWLHTGDRGHLDEDGYLYVEGRLEQDMIVLPSGENISPAKVEAIVNACDGVEESIVLARDGKLIALVVLNHELPSPPTGSPTEQVSWGVFGEGQGVRLRNELLAQINPQLPAYSQLFGIEFLSEPLARTEKKTLKRYLYK